MSNYRRARTPGGTFFFTVATYLRRPILTHPPIRAALREAVREVRAGWPFGIDAWVLLPDHLHCLWTLPDDDTDYSQRWAAIKRAVTKACAERYGSRAQSASRLARFEGGIWQRRFWEHQIRNEDDLRRHMDYIYWNPVKHGLVSRVIDWPYSTFHRDVRLGVYPPDWGGDGITADTAEFGEPV